MAGDWIKMRTNLDTDPAVVRISSGLRMDRYAVVGRLHKIWTWANEHLTDGQDVPVDCAFLDMLVEHSGFAESMRSVGWLSGRDGSLCFPSFERHNGASAKARALDAERKRQARNASGKCPGANRTELRPEKRRVEKRRDSTENKQKVDLSAQFREWWRAYPKRVGRDRAAVAYEKAVHKIAKSEVVTELEAADLLLKWTRERVEVVNSFEEKFRPHPASWLNGGHYTDEIALSQSVSRIPPIESLADWRPS